MDKKIEALQLKAAELTRESHALGIPVMVVFEGVPASGKTRLTNELLLTLDAKYTHFIATKTPSEHDLRYQFLQNYWNTLPSKGDINIYFRSWYAHFIDYKIHGIKKSTFKHYDKLKAEIHAFESMLQNDAHEIIKFYIQINEEKRQEHINEMKDNPLTNWKAQEYENVIPSDVYRQEFQHILNEEWEVIDYTNRTHAIQHMYEHLIARLEKAIHRHHNRKKKINGAFSEPFSTDIFNVQIEKTRKSDYDALLLSLQLRLKELQFALYERKIPLILVYEGMDAAGKGGNIKRVREYLDPTGYEVNAISAPTDVELNHHYLWRFAKDMPKSGHIEIFDRSWYGRVLVERVEGFATYDEWSRAYDEINAFEQMWVNDGAIVLKFFLTLDKDEQLKRFKDREQNINKQWKITDEDWRNREKWDLYLEASHDMITKTHQAHAPWVIVPADHKKSARIEVLKYIIQKCEERLWGVKYY
ncbi:phosphate--AMP phosphotransferase [Staphylococcus agnetis]|uniref:phosphate--AMP phosphotransferase n=1 Tax=Staphylococcus agnetis TaxID=985762 RepID=UPI00208F6208|nr:phosphate--AMP phosphotransferase [Staphylococcus agnetis]MCO4338547.1 phosphate--AMP phosphotransferase [Staphylococcus agnetis]MCO4340232.1 phosphate--AMP phosphotransferase [Staphylococcus agnetis]MCO4343818.1 phosphate--AMP phosphotransferase [Staphylococcus agnetis]MCO4346677.1 phosphate--AMP phosphotransferase [Staphylococcus agnetis]MCO4347196.1 phosphate--AMP phosphotransferase [Staphylococcus agnetis]